MNVHWKGSIFDEIREKLEGFSIDIEDMCGPDFDKSKIKIVCVAPGLADSVKEMGKAIRDQVVMVRIDEDSSKSLDAWVEAGAVKSRSEAAALFIREGLKVRGSELEMLQDALKDVAAAKQRLRDKAKNIFGDEEEGESEAENGESESEDKSD